MNKNRQKGFTLTEMLIVVASIAVLATVSIPVVSSRLEKSREASDIANMRSARGVLTTSYLCGEAEAGTLLTYYYDGREITMHLPSKGYGKGTSSDGKTIYNAGNGCALCNYDASADHSGDYLMGSVGLDDTIHIHWVNAGLSLTPALPKLDPNWVSWTMTDSRGVGGSVTRSEVLKALGLSEAHEFTFCTAKNGTYVVYIYAGNFPDAAKSGDSKGRKALDEWLDYSSSKSISVSAYSYDPKSETTKFIGQKPANAVLREKSGNRWIQIQPVG